MAAFRRPIICLVTDRRRLPPPDEDSLVRLVSRAAAAGVDLIHLREPDLDDRRLLALTCDVVAAAASVPVVVNDRTDVAVAAGAAGVHLRGDSIPARRLRPIVPRGFLIGRSVHSAEDVRAQEEGLDYMVMGTVYPTASKAAGGEIAGLAGLEQACRATRLPVLAIGGVTADKVGDIAASGAAGVAAIGLFADLTGADSDEADDALSTLVAGVRRDFAARTPLT